MKRIKKVLTLLLALAFLTFAFTSCSLFEKSGTDQAKKFKHTQPLPKKYIINQKNSNIIK